MKLNNREVSIVTYSTEKNWVRELPTSNWLCVLVNNDRPRNYINEVIAKIIAKDVCWVCTVGKSCVLVHDLIDEEIVFRQVDPDDLYLPKHDMMTTWHTDFDEGIWFSIFAANDDEVSIDKVVILDMTNGEERERIIKLLEEYKVSG